MAKAEASSVKRTPSSSRPRVRGPYKHPCNVCRLKKRGCDEQRPTCGPCVKDGRQDECSWDKEKVAHKPRAEAHFEALNKRIFVLRDYARRLEQILEACEREHGGVHSNSGLSFREMIESRPSDMDQVIAESNDCESTADDATNYNFVDELCISTQNLKFSGDSTLIYHGPTAVFTYASTESDFLTSRFPAIADDPQATYVLITDGVDESHYNPHFDWSRHLPNTVPLIRKEHDKLLSLTFSFFTSWCFRIVPALFLRDMYRALSGPRTHIPPRTAHYSPMLHNALVALACCFSDDPRICDLNSRQYFAEEAKKYIEEECRRPTLSGIHALSTLASFYSSQGDQALGYAYFGMSARLSQSLGLSMDCSAWVNSGLIAEDDRLDRNWAYWTTFSQDVCWSLYVGRDFGVPFPSGVAHIPVPFVDSDFDQMTWKDPQGNVPEQPNLLSKTFAATVGLLMIARRIMDLVYAFFFLRFCPPSFLLTIHSLALNTWKSNLSSDVDLTPKSRSTATPHRLMLHLCYWWLTILIHRPFYHRTTKQIHSSDKEIDHIKHCKRAAQNIMELAEIWRDLYTLRYVPVTFIQTIFSAGTIYLLQAVQATQGIRVAEKELYHGHEQATRCIQYLLEVGKSFQAATNIAEILKNLVRKQVNPRIERSPTKPAVPALQFHPADTGHSPRRRRQTPSANESPGGLMTNNHTNEFLPSVEGTTYSSGFNNSPSPQKLLFSSPLLLLHHNYRHRHLPLSITHPHPLLCKPFLLILLPPVILELVLQRLFTHHSNLRI
ncbi:hypothetical protein BDQ17DRAFT_1503158 [Cyathus striatus]|nr:hypothetical protein BDQ17DRAFT_1503158 [Cyathus striatus]